MASSNSESSRLLLCSKLYKGNDKVEDDVDGDWELKSGDAYNDLGNESLSSSYSPIGSRL